MEDLAVVIFLIALMAIFIGGICWMDKISCNSQTNKIGFEHSWGIAQGCLIETKPGIWVPLDNYRVI